MAMQKKPCVAVIFNFPISGMGQIYCGYFPRGFIFLLLNFFSGSTFAVQGRIAIVIAVPVLVVAMLDAYFLAKRINAVENSK
ncbi:MAG: hypothetical protein M1539_06940 [Actinobacteria bacterium]|nr:hypothetical protein [Actinomycetota bacterium]MCL5883690.1 hypothetical protein [Actinomycetota bacterium]